MKEKEIIGNMITNNLIDGDDLDEFEAKRDLVEIEIDVYIELIQKITQQVETGLVDLNAYKTSIVVELDYERQILKKAEEIENETEKAAIVNRIKERIAIIETELTQNPEEEDNGEENNINENLKSIEKSNSEHNKIMIIENVNNPDRKNIEVKDNSELISNLKNLLSEYRKAIEYFAKIESTEQTVDARTKAQEISKAIKKLENNEEIDEYSLPLNVTPEFICGMSKKERIAELAKIIKNYSGRKVELSEKMKKLLEKFKTLEKRDLIKKKDEIKSTLDNIKKKINGFNNIIIRLQEVARDAWIPIPLTETIEEEDKIEKINEAIEPSSVVIKIGKLENAPKGGQVYLEFVFPYGDGKEIREYVNQRGDNEFDYVNKVKLEKAEYNALFRKGIEVYLYSKSCFCFKATVLGVLKLKLEAFKSSSDIVGAIDFKSIEAENDRRTRLIGSKLNIEIKIRNSIVDKEYEIITKEVMNVTKFYDSYKIEETNKKAENKEKAIKNTKIEIKVKEKKEEVEEIKFKIKEKTKENIGVVSIDPKLFSELELNSPDHIDLIISLKALDKKIKDLEEQINQIEGRAPRELREQLIKHRVKYKTIEGQMQEGEINIDQYILILKNRVDHERKLNLYFQNTNQVEKSKIVSERVNLMIKELGDAIDFYKSNKK